jgi:hypothetical protein
VVGGLLVQANLGPKIDFFENETLDCYVLLGQLCQLGKASLDNISLS